mmetsp:Transcript_18631/g.46311  ORF Transcript_18631/g.46311 Transcript_18631/m.46311 type:complete len:209 (+) Transcript_18631:457-1083(+)
MPTPTPVEAGASSDLTRNTRSSRRARHPTHTRSGRRRSGGRPMAPPPLTSGRRHSASVWTTTAATTATAATAATTVAEAAAVAGSSATSKIASARRRRPEAEAWAEAFEALPTAAVQDWSPLTAVVAAVTTTAISHPRRSTTAWICTGTTRTAGSTVHFRPPRARPHWADWESAARAGSTQGCSTHSPGAEQWTTMTPTPTGTLWGRR